MPEQDHDPLPRVTERLSFSPPPDVAPPLRKVSQPRPIRLDPARHQQIVTPPDLSWWLRALPYGLFLAVACSVFALSVDDPFITFRYAANVLAGHGPVFNVGERVEGFSSPLHLLLCLALLKIAPSVGVLFKAKLASLLCGLLVLRQMRGFARLFALSKPQTILAQTLVALNINFALAAVNGLETTLYASLLLASVSLFVLEYRHRRGVASAFVLFLALLARPETLLVFVGLLGLRAYWNRQRRIGRGATLRWALAFVLPANALSAARLAYYGTLLPNTYYAKHLMIGAALKLGGEYLLQTLSPVRLEIHHFVQGQTTVPQALQLLFAPLFWGLAWKGWLRCRRTLEGQALGIGILATVLFVLRSGGDWMTGWRFLIGALPFLALLQARGLTRQTPLQTLWLGSRPTLRGRERAWKSAVGVGAVLAVWLLALCVAPHRSWRSVGFSTGDKELLADGYGFSNVWIAVDNYVRRFAPSGAVIAYTEMGYTPYHNLDKRFIDVRGLTEPEIAHLPDRYKRLYGASGQEWYQAGSPLYSFLHQRKPDLIVWVNLPSLTQNLPEYTLRQQLIVDTPVAALPVSIYAPRR